MLLRSAPPPASASPTPRRRGRRALPGKRLRSSRAEEAPPPLAARAAARFPDAAARGAACHYANAYPAAERLVIVQDGADVGASISTNGTGSSGSSTSRSCPKRAARDMARSSCATSRGRGERGKRVSSMSRSSTGEAALRTPRLRAGRRQGVYELMEWTPPAPGRSARRRPPRSACPNRRGRWLSRRFRAPPRRGER